MEVTHSILQHTAPFLLLIFQIFCFQTTIAASIAVTLSGSSNESDQVALLSFKSPLSDNPLGPLASWNASFPFCKWPGVTCGGNRHPDRVIALDLESLGLTGPISPSLANLTFLRRLHLSGNSLRGYVPEEFGHLYRLKYLNLSRNSLQGGIPDTLLNITTLRSISFRSNQLQGDLPSNFPPLTDLDLSNNMFTGLIPQSLGNTSALTYLDISNNSLTGSIPSSIGMLSFLTLFDLSKNNFTGDISSSIWNLSLLTVFEVHTNNLSGELPPDLGNSLPLLQRLLLYENQFSGPIPMSISNASNLMRMEIYYNEFGGTIPWTLGTLRNLYSLILGNNQLEAKDDQDWRFFNGLVNCTNLQILDVSNNMLGGRLPDAITNLSTGLTWLGLMGNQISGSIPPGISNLVNLNELRMRDNLLTGRIPSTIAKLPVLQELYLSGNMFTGEIPTDISNLTQLNLLYLEANQLSGTIPKTLGNLKNLLLLNLGHNKLSGTIPVEILRISSLSIYLSFSNNLLTGPLPLEVGGLVNLDALDVSYNKLSGSIPGTLGQCLIMEFLFMEGNLFQGSIPSSFSQLRGLQVLDLSHNNLSGKIPEFLEDFKYLHTLNLSFNDFEGAVPKGGAFSNLTEISVLGNYKLCGGSPVLDLPPCAVQPPKKKHVSSKLKVIIAVATIVVCLILLTCSLIAFYGLKKSRTISTVTNIKDTHMTVSYNALVQATDGFSESNLIGKGSVGSVYRATMELGKETIVAVKVINHQQKGASKSFMAECEALRNVRHRNLVKILTTCSSADFSGNEFKALIFEFMPNGSLEKWLHPGEHDQEQRPKLSLSQRLSIAIDVASALDYLHHYGEVPIVHCDLKPSNVLLDNDMVAHVGDFGLAKFLDKNVSEASHISISSSGLKGTIGYVPPEYGMTDKVSTEGDVYSYGILLLEMFTGKSPIDNSFTEGMSLHKFVDTAFPGRVMDVVDTYISLEEDEVANDNIQRVSKKRGELHECLVSVLRVGLSCTLELPSKRMRMGDVTKKLIAAKDAFCYGDEIEEVKNT